MPLSDSMPFDEHLAHLEADGIALRRAAERDFSASVPSCPGWDAGVLLGHVGRVHTWATRCLDTSPSDRVRFDDVPAAPAIEELGRWYTSVHRSLVEALQRAGPDALVATWSRPQPARWWARRQAHETAVHRWDAQAAHEPPIARDLACDGIDEFLEVFAPLIQARCTGTGGVIVLIARDAPRRWDLRLGPDNTDVSYVRFGHRVGTIEGGASDLLLALWGRLQPSALAVDGDVAAFDAWRATAMF